MGMVIAVVLATILAASVPAASSSAPTGWVDGWYTFAGGTTTTRSFSDRTPARTSVVLFLQKKAGPRYCRAQVTARSGGATVRYLPVYKYTRSSSRAFGAAISWPTAAATKTITVSTNGHCFFRIYAK
jgi:hypothetical protein